ncbi:MAG: hypothetical protein L0I76_17870 [Pseudonocardia sp.]|nr:hypothetical protein [Pseudonocardia sp.]
MPDPATRAARPAVWTPRRPEPDLDESLDTGSVTDPFGFPPVPPVVGSTIVPPEPTSWAGWGPAPDAGPPESATARGAGAAGSGGADAGCGATTPQHLDDPPVPDPADAAALAAAFAADYLSWDEDDPERRGRALAGYLPGPRTDRALLGWSGRGRQRAEIVLPGRVRPDGDGRVLVDVRARVTPYRRVDQRGSTRPEADPEEPLGEPAAAPPATARGWRGLASRWVRLGVTVALVGHDLVVDAGEQMLPDAPGEQPAPATRTAHPDRTVDGDDPPSPLSLAVRCGGAR